MCEINHYTNVFLCDGIDDRQNNEYFLRQSDKLSFHFSPFSEYEAHDNSEHTYTIINDMMHVPKSVVSQICLKNDKEYDEEGDCESNDTDSMSANADDDDDLSFFNRLTEDTLIDMEEHIFEWIDESLKSEIIHFSNPNFHGIIISEVSEMVVSAYSYLSEFNEDDDDDYADIINLVTNCVNVFFNTDMSNPSIPKRSYPDSHSVGEIDYKHITQIISTLSNRYQPAQRTPEWYEYRHSMMTASNIYKALGSDALINSLIFDKCKPFDNGKCVAYSGNVESSLNFGIRYEPVSLLLYEHIFKTKVSDFGCLKHPLYDYIGASPDGINTDIQSSKYGRMLEIKNIVNREITGIPLEAYWIQMQFQMEVCGLDECDFFETRFKEFDNESEFYNYNDDVYKGLMLHFMRTSEFHEIEPETVYIHMPMSLVETLRNVKIQSNTITKSIVEIKRSIVKKWIDTIITENSELSLHTIKYWRLDEMSCVLVSRNNVWISAAIPKISEIWNIIVREREDGWEHRAPKKRVKVETLMNGTGTLEESISRFSKNGKGVCVIKLDPEFELDAENE